MSRTVASALAMQMQMQMPVLGLGWSFPVERDPSNGRMAMSVEEESVGQAIGIILSTRRGERVMRPNFGCDLGRLLFAPNDATVQAMAAFDVREALTAWEPRIDVLNVVAHSDGELGEQLVIEVDYRVLSTDNRYNLVYPFYLDRAIA